MTEFNLSDKKEIDEILSGHGLNKSFRKYIISLFENKEKQFIKLLKDFVDNDHELWDDICEETWRKEMILDKINSLTGEELIK